MYNMNLYIYQEYKGFISLGLGNKHTCAFFSNNRKFNLIYSSTFVFTIVNKLLAYRGYRKFNKTLNEM